MGKEKPEKKPITDKDELKKLQQKASALEEIRNRKANLEKMHIGYIIANNEMTFSDAGLISSFRAAALEYLTAEEAQAIADINPLLR